MVVGVADVPSPGTSEKENVPSSSFAAALRRVGLATLLLGSTIELALLAWVWMS